MEVKTFMDEVAALPGGEKINECIQCGICGGSCPTAKWWEYPPRKVIAMVRNNMKKEVLSSNSLWFCASCYLCVVRCPRDIKPAEIMHALETIAVREGYKPPTWTPIMYHSFVDSIKAHGRVWEMGMMLKYYLRTNPFAALKMLPVALSLFSHGRLSLSAKSVKGKQEIKTILNKVKAIGGPH